MYLYEYQQLCDFMINWFSFIGVRSIDSVHYLITWRAGVWVILFSIFYIASIWINYLSIANKVFFPILWVVFHYCVYFLCKVKSFLMYIISFVCFSNYFLSYSKYFSKDSFFGHYLHLYLFASICVYFIGQDLHMRKII